MPRRPRSIVQRATRRRWLASLALGVPTLALASGSAGPATIEAWLDLSEPVPAQAASEARENQARRVAAQQEAVAARLRELGVVEVAHVRHARNALLVRMDPRQADLVRGIPGVVRVRPGVALHPPKPMP